jgi:DNA-directed RNA polymerase specialized sigma24 family protein
MASTPAPSLEELGRVSRQITEKQGEVNALSERRQDLIRALDAQGVTYADMARAMGVTVQTVYRLAPKGRRQ